jgi:hypothetical protein
MPQRAVGQEATPLIAGSSTPRSREERPLKIACVHTMRNLSGEVLGAMNVIRFLRMSEALARRGHRVDLVLKEPSADLPVADRIGKVASSRVQWEDYDVVKTCFHSGFAALTAWNGDDHPFILSNLGSVVGATDADGVYFYGTVREDLWTIQQRLAARSRYVSLLTQPNADLYREMHGDAEGLLRVPAGVDAEVPGPSVNPYAALGITRPVALYAGNIYTRDRQAEMNLFWQERLNALGRALDRRGIQFVVMGLGAIDHLDPACVVHVGVIDFRAFWNWQWHASVGIVLAQGAVQHNESSKIYYYLRTGLPVACEASVPNAWLVSHTGHGAVVDYDADDIVNLAEAATQLARRPPEMNGLIPYMIAEHSWDARAAVYASVLARCPASRGGLERVSVCSAASMS